MTEQAMRIALGNLGYFQLALHEVREDSLEPNRRLIVEEHQHKRLLEINDEGYLLLEMN